MKEYMKQYRDLFFVMIIASCGVVQAAPLRLAPFYSDNMVLQRDLPVVVLGAADPNDAITVEFAGKMATAVAGTNGLWKAILPAVPVSTAPHELVATSKATGTKVRIGNVLVGDVWLCAGQSNMARKMRQFTPLTQEGMDTANFPHLRRIRFALEIALDPVPSTDMQIETPWEQASTNTVPDWTATGFFFGRNIHKASGIPIGLLDSNWGGTRIEPWTPSEAFEGVPAFSNEVDKIKNRIQLLAQNDVVREEFRQKAAKASPEERKKMRQPRKPWGSEGSPAATYNAMIDGLTQFPIKGVIWYQGEGNHEDPLYDLRMQTLVSAWRKKWGCDFPFYFVQLAGWGRPHPDPTYVGWGRIRQLQLTAFKTIPKCGMAVAIDIGDPKDVHPLNKVDVGERLSRWALRDLYGKPDTVVSGPLYDTMKVEGNKAVISFLDTTLDGSAARDRRYDLIVGRKVGLAPVVELKDGKLDGFAVQDAEGSWVWAKATIEGRTVVVTHPENKPVRNVRYGYQNSPAANLYNREGLPASPFTTEKLDEEVRNTPVGKPARK